MSGVLSQIKQIQGWSHERNLKCRGAPMKPKPWHVLAVPLMSLLFIGTIVAFTNKSGPVNCHDYAERARERRRLTKRETKQVEHSCATSRIYGSVRLQEDARALADGLVKRKACSPPGPYVAHDPRDDDRWVVFCPML